MQFTIITVNVKFVNTFYKKIIKKFWNFFQGRKTLVMFTKCLHLEGQFGRSLQNVYNFIARLA